MENSADALQAAWQPTAAMIRAAKITAFTDWLAAERSLRFADYDALCAQYGIEQIREGNRGINGARIFGGVLYSSLTITEIGI